jgi:hypothetical protein
MKSANTAKKTGFSYTPLGTTDLDPQQRKIELLRKTQNDELVGVLNEEKIDEEKRVAFLKKSSTNVSFQDNDGENMNQNGLHNGSSNNDSTIDSWDNNDSNNNKYEHADLLKLFSMERREASDRIMNLIKVHNDNLKNAMSSNTVGFET